MDFRLKDFRYPSQIWRFRRFLAENEKRKPQEIEAWQLTKLQEILKHAYSQVPYYHCAFDKYNVKPSDLHHLSDLKKFPILTKETVRGDARSLQAKDFHKYDPVESYTSGSTGTALKFFLDRDTNVLEFASLWRIFNWAGYHFGNRFCDLRGRTLSKDRLWSYDLRLNSLNLSSFNFKKEKMALYARLLKLFRPVMIRGYPSSISLLAQWFSELGINDIHPKTVVTSSETLLEHQRKIIEKVFDCKVLDYYGQMERVCLISQCPQGSYHIHPEYGFVEILNEKGEPVKPGEVGEIVATSLHNKAMPFIRYRTRDLATFSNNHCLCDLPYKTIGKIYGRIEDIVVTPDGRYVGRLDAAFKYSAGIRYAQIVQDDVKSITVKIVKDDNYSQEDTQKILAELRKRLGDIIKINIKFVKQISTTQAGKFKFVISKVLSAGQKE